jgi:hypothetical protein
VASKHKRDEALAKLKATSRRQEARISQLEREVESLRAALAQLVRSPDRPSTPPREIVGPAAAWEQPAAPSAAGLAATLPAPGAAASRDQMSAPPPPASGSPAARDHDPLAGEAPADDPFAGAETAIRELQRALSKPPEALPEPSVQSDRSEAHPPNGRSEADPQPEADTGAGPEAHPAQRHGGGAIGTRSPSPDEGAGAAAFDGDDRASAGGERGEGESPLPAQPRPWWRIF